MRSAETPAPFSPFLVTSLALVQAFSSAVGFRHPKAFWPLMTASLSLMGIPALGRLRRDPGELAPASILEGACAGIGAFAITAAAAAVLQRSRRGRHWLGQLGACSTALGARRRFLLLLPAAAGEELFWRETVLGQRLGNSVQPSPRDLIGPTLVYSLVQASSLHPLPPVGGLLLGSLCGWLRLRSGSIWPALAAHLTYSELCLVSPGLPGAHRAELHPIEFQGH